MVGKCRGGIWYCGCEDVRDGREQQLEEAEVSRKKGQVDGWCKLRQ
jgi:hypothetical protein